MVLALVFGALLLIGGAALMALNQEKGLAVVVLAVGTIVVFAGIVAGSP